MTQLSSITFAAGAITTAYGAYSYATVKGKKRHVEEQRAKAMKVMAVGVGLLSVGAALYFYGRGPVPQLEEQILDAEHEKNAPEYLKPYVNRLLGKAVPKAGNAITKFPPHLYKFPHSGYLTTKEGWNCKLPFNVPPLEECHDAWAPRVEELKIEQPSAYALATMDHESRWAKGRLLVTAVQSKFKEFGLGMDKTIPTSYARGLKLAEGLFLQDPHFESQSERSIVDSIKEVHRVMVENVKHKNPSLEMGGGIFRSENAVIADDRMHNWSEEGFKKYLKAHGGLESEYKHVDSWFEKVDRYDGAVPPYDEMSAEEMATIKKIVHLPMEHTQIPAGMLDFAKKLKEIYSLVKRKLLHPIPAAAWTHQQCGEIHPFNDGNGRICRALQNVVLQWGGIKGVVISDDPIYTHFIKEDNKLAGIFSEYLDKTIRWNAMQKAFNS